MKPRRHANSFLLLTFLSLLVACQQRAVLKIYVLDAETLSPRESRLDETVVVIRDIVFADYISQTHLMMQSSTHELDIAKWHVWQGSLAKSFERALLNDLNEGGELLFVSDELLGFEKHTSETLELSLKIEKAFPSQDGMISLSGYFWLKNKHAKKYYAQFSLSDELSGEGYESAVEQLRALVKKLAIQIREKSVIMQSASEEVKATPTVAN